MLYKSLHLFDLHLHFHPLMIHTFWTDVEQMSLDDIYREKKKIRCTFHCKFVTFYWQCSKVMNLSLTNRCLHLTVIVSKNKTILFKKYVKYLHSSLARHLSSCCPFTRSSKSSSWRSFLTLLRRINRTRTRRRTPVSRRVRPAKIPTATER